MFIVSAGCSKKFYKNPDTLMLHLRSDPITLNPVLAEDAYSSTVISHVYETLLERDNATLEMKGLLATHWTISPNNLVFTFYLRHGVKFHDNQPFTSKDVVFTFQKTMDEKTPNPQKKVYFQDVLYAYAPDDFTVVFVMKKPYYKSLEFLGSMEIIPEHIFAKLDNFVMNDYNMKTPVGTGPYILTSWKTREKVVLARNEAYWGKLPDIKKLEYKIIEEDSVALQALKKQELDLNNLNSFQWVRQTDSQKFNKTFNKIKYLATSYNYIGYNTRKIPFNDKRVREAMTYLVDREKIRQTIMNDLAEITTGNFWINSKQYNHDLVPRKYNPQKALELLNSAGYKENKDGFLEKNGKTLSFELMVPSGADFYRKFTPIFKENLSKFGIVVNIRQIQFQALIEKVNKRDFEAMMLGWSMDIENDPYQLWHSSQIEKGHNFTGFTTPELDYLIELARLEFNTDLRNRYYHRIHEILYENQPYTFLFTSYNLVAIQKRFQNVNVYKTGLDFREWIIVQ
ncbi:MAG: peptide-binding protein [Spirochaetia bacterium]|nr:peptide-binding protein [Spirochaetia bacterium]